MSVMNDFTPEELAEYGELAEAATPKRGFAKFSGQNGQYTFPKPEGSDEDAPEMKTFEGVILGTWTGRALFGGDKTPFLMNSWLCRNRDVRTSTPQRNDSIASDDAQRLVEAGWSGDCGTCGLAQWRKNATGSDSPPLCGEVVNILVLAKGVDEPFILSIKSRFGVLEARKYLGGFVKRRQFFARCITKFSSQKVTKGSQNYYIPTFTQGAMLPADQYRDMRSLSQGTLGAARALQEPEEQRNAAPSSEIVDFDDNDIPF